MLRRTLILLVLAQTQWGCDINLWGEPLPSGDLESGRGSYQTGAREARASEDRRPPSRRWNHCLQGRRLKAEIEVRYADDGTTISKGPLVTYVGFKGLLATDLHDRFMLIDSQHGIQLEFNGMTVGGKRRVTISPELVCGGIDQGCFLLRPERQFVNEIRIRKVCWLSRPC